MKSSLEVEDWKGRLAAMQADPARVAHNEAVNRGRLEIVPEMLDLLRRFSSRSVPVEAFRAEFDSRTRVEWEGFGFKGMSGAMFLNKLVKYLDQAEVDEALRAVLAVPPNDAEGERRMRDFETFLEERIDSGKATRGQLQPARLTFLVSGMWHLQDRETWPIHYQSGRATLRAEELIEEKGIDSTSDYFEFREVFRQIAQPLSIDSWTCEHLLDWINQGGSSTGKVAHPPPPPLKVDPPASSEDATHTHVQGLLAQIGRALGCQVWVAANDRSKLFRGARLGDECLDDLPRLGLDDDSQRIVRLIDVVWIKGERQIAAAFEIEHTTSIYSGLLRMSDLAALSPNLSFPLYIVAPESRMNKVEEQLRRPTFEALGLDRLCQYFSNETLVAEADGIMRWAHDPSAIRRIARRVGGD
jgi:hypothetical protein